mmetsp:Transcript_31509/g.68709  ORF Transcript_31509/g.68709 Transcript_31509/m.68709 type:complete len:97 (-) Transcript_31509:198-488(-)
MEKWLDCFNKWTLLKDHEVPTADYRIIKEFTKYAFEQSNQELVLTDIKGALTTRDNCQIFTLIDPTVYEPLKIESFEDRLNLLGSLSTLDILGIEQ